MDRRRRIMGHAARSSKGLDDGLYAHIYIRLYASKIIFVLNHPYLQTMTTTTMTSRGDLVLADVACGLPFRSNCFRKVISVSCLQWLCSSCQKESSTGPSALALRLRNGGVDRDVGRIQDIIFVLVAALNAPLNSCSLFLYVCS